MDLDGGKIVLILLGVTQEEISWRISKDPGTLFADKAVETRQKNEAAKAEAEVEAKAKNAPGAGASGPADTAPTGTGGPTATNGPTG